MLQKHLFGLIVFSLMVIGCASTETIESTKVSPAEIYRSYAVRGSKEGSHSTVIFRVGGSSGTTVDLDLPSKIEHNGEEMSESKPTFMKGIDYFDSANQFASQQTFVYTDGEGKTWKDEISLQPLEIVSTKIDFTKKNGGIIELSRPLGESEQISFSLVSDSPAPPERENEENIAGNIKVNKINYSVSFTGELSENRQTVTVRNQTLSKFKEGSAKISLTVHKTEKMTNGGKGGSISAFYESQKILANVAN